MNEQEILAAELHAPARKHFPTRKVYTLGINDLWQADLVDMQELASKNKHHNYILTVLDVFSKMGYARALKTKSADAVTAAFADVLKEARKAPSNLHTDEGKEFFNAKFSALMKKHNINHYHTYSDKKASVVERWNRTLKTKMWRKFTELNTRKWLDLLPELVHEYNHTHHGTIKMRPVEVAKRIDEVKKLNRPDKVDEKPAKFKLGDIVRISRAKSIFAKGYREFNWSEELFKIYKIKNTDPRTYLIEDLAGEPVKGSFYALELKRTKIPDYARIEKIVGKKVDKKTGDTWIRVKWSGYDNKFNSWIKKDSTLKL